MDANLTNANSSNFNWSSAGGGGDDDVGGGGGGELNLLAIVATSVILGLMTLITIVGEKSRKLLLPFVDSLYRIAL